MLVLYTAILGPSGDRLEPLGFEPGPEFHAVAYLDPVTRRHLGIAGERYGGWEIRPPFFTHGSSRRQARQHKLLAHELFPQARYTLWIDGCLTPRVDPRTLVDRYLGRGTELAAFKHPERDCIYQEGPACIKLRKDHANVINAQLARYREEGYPRRMGLAETTAVLRENTNALREFNYRWWVELSNGSVRDQLSFDYTCWQLGVRYNHIKGSRTASPYFHWRSHLR